MHFIFSYLRKRPHFLVLGIILLLGLFFRTYQLIERADFGHDADLYSWIVKDIVVDGHFRLVGQQTSALGIYIGPLFYYPLIPFYLISNMDPGGVIYFIPILGAVTIISYYFVFSELFKTKIGLIATFIYATSLATINHDRWLVPTITTNLWVIWYFYSIIKITRGDFRTLPLLGILIGLIWHVHIALIPTLVAIPTAIMLSRKLPSGKLTLLSLILFLMTSLPFIIFELKHGFGQILSFIFNSQTNRIGPEGIFKLTLILNMITKNANDLLIAIPNLNITSYILLILLVFYSTFWLIKRNLFKKELLVLLTWIFGVVIFFEVSSSPISEYYFSSIDIIFITITSFLLYILLKSSSLGKNIVVSLLLLILIKNGYLIINQKFYHKGYQEKKAVVDYIYNDAEDRNFPCFSINYITSPGENVGFRYFFYLKKAKLAVPGRGSPVYSIVIPDEYASKEVKVKFGHIGIIPPREVASEKVIKEACSGENTNLTDPMFGYVD